MARIQLRDAIVRFLDGHSNTGQVNDTPAPGDDTLTVNMITGIIPKWAKMQIAGSNRTYRVVSAVGGPNTTEVTFEPPLATDDGIPSNGAAITFGGRFVEARMGDGDLNYTENKELEYELERGKLDTVREVNDVPMDVTMDAVWEFLRGSTGQEPTMEDVLKRRGEAEDWISSAADDPCAPYAVDLEIEYRPPCGGEENEYILLPDLRYDSLDHSIQEATISLTGRCNAKEAIVARA